MLNPLNKPSFLFLGIFSKTANLKFFKKYILFLILKFTVLHRAKCVLFLHTNKPDSARRAPCQRIPTIPPFPDRAEVAWSQDSPTIAPLAA